MPTEAKMTAQMKVKAIAAPKPKMTGKIFVPGAFKMAPMVKMVPMVPMVPMKHPKMIMPL